MKFTRENIEKELEKFPKEFAVAFAYRCALRALPILVKNGNFDFSKEYEKEKHIFPIFRLMDLPEIFILDKKYFPADACAVVDTFDDYVEDEGWEVYEIYADYAETAATAVAYAYAVDDYPYFTGADGSAYAKAVADAYAYEEYGYSEFYPFEEEDEYEDCSEVYDDAYNAYNTYAAAVNAAYASARNVYNSIIEKEIFYDIELLHYIKDNKKNIIELLKAPLWKEEPDIWNELLSSFKKALSSIGFEYWFDVYIDKINFETDILELKQRINIPPEIKEQGAEKITSYLISLKKEGAERLNEIKVIFMGDGDAGKTSIIKKIFDIDAALEKTDPTQGVEINEWELEDKETKAHLWDFGGQVIMHATHQFFLSERSVYVVVLDGRKEQIPDYWLDHVKAFGGSSPTLVIMNKIDLFDHDVERNTLKRKYPNITEFYKVSCDTQKDVKNNELKRFVSDLENIITEAKSWDANLPKSWFSVKENLKKTNDDFISFEKFQSICEQNKIEEEEKQDDLIESLHALGIAIYFKNLEYFSTYVLSPEWLTNAVYKIINSDILKEYKGILKLESLKIILNKKEYPYDKHLFIMKVMEEFELAYKIDDKTFLIPNLLDKDEPKKLIPFKNDALSFRFSFSFFPISIIARFIVRMANNIKRQDLCWRNGVVLENRLYNTQALVMADYNEKVIDIWITGDQKRDYFAILRSHFHEIFKTFKEFQPIELVPIEEGIYEDYKHLIGLESMGEDEYSCGKIRKKFNLIKLLNGFEAIEKRQKRIRERKNFHVNINPHIEVNPHIETVIKNETNINIDIKVKNEAVSEIKKLLNNIEKEASSEIKNSTDKEIFLEEVKLAKNASKEIEKEDNKNNVKQFNSMNRLLNFIDKIHDKTTKIGKIVSLSDKLVGYGKKLAPHLYKIAKWCQDSNTLDMLKRILEP
jgi:internalin A